MESDTLTYTKHCHRCQVAKEPGCRVQNFPGHLTATTPFEVIAMDFAKVDAASDGRDTILVMTDIFSHFTKVVPV